MRYDEGLCAFGMLTSFWPSSDYAQKLTFKAIKKNTHTLCIDRFGGVAQSVSRSYASVLGSRRKLSSSNSSLGSYNSTEKHLLMDV